MTKFFQKKEWSDGEWQIFFSNLDIIRNYNQLNKSEFAERINVGNAYRRDRKKPSPLAVKSICNEFKVDKKWLATSHTPATGIQVFLAHSHSDTVGEQDKDYTPHGDPPKITTEALTGIPPGKGMGHAVSLLTDIFEYNDNEMIERVIEALHSIKNSAQLRATLIGQGRRDSRMRYRDSSSETEIEERLRMLEKIVQEMLMEH